VAANPPPGKSNCRSDRGKRHSAFAHAAELTFKDREGSALGRSFLRRQN
jgi:hypothetical protein